VLNELASNVRNPAPAEKKNVLSPTVGSRFAAKVFEETTDWIVSSFYNHSN